MNGLGRLTPLDSELLEYTFERHPGRSPYALYDRLRARGDCHRSALGMSLIVGYGLAREVLRDPRFGNDISHWQLYEQLAGLEGREVYFWKAAKRQLLLLDPPDHTRLRRLMSPPFAYRQVNQLNGLIEQIVDDVLAGVSERDQVEFVSEVSRRIPVKVIAQLMGVPRDDVEHFDQLAQRLSISLDPMQMYLSEQATSAADDAARCFANYVAELALHKRRSPSDDVMSQLATAHSGDGEPVSDEELGAGCALLLIAGLDTSTNLLANALAVLLREPTFDANAVRSHQEWSAIVEEVVRLESPIQATARVAMCDVELQGQYFFRGDLVLVINGAANRDPREFQQPERFLPERVPNAHLGFGHGRHLCLGATLARQQAAIALPRAVSALRGFRIADGSPSWRASFSFRGPERLLLRRESTA